MTDEEILEATLSLLEMPPDEMGQMIGQTLMICLVALAYTNEETIDDAKVNLWLAVAATESPDWKRTRIGIADALERRAHR